MNAFSLSHMSKLSDNLLKVLTFTRLHFEVMLLRVLENGLKILEMFLKG